MLWKCGDLKLYLYFYPSTHIVKYCKPPPHPHDKKRKHNASFLPLAYVCSVCTSHVVMGVSGVAVATPAEVSLAEELDDIVAVLETREGTGNWGRGGCTIHTKHLWSVGRSVDCYAVVPCRITGPTYGKAKKTSAHTYKIRYRGKLECRQGKGQRTKKKVLQVFIRSCKNHTYKHTYKHTYDTSIHTKIVHKTIQVHIQVYYNFI